MDMKSINTSFPKSTKSIKHSSLPRLTLRCISRQSRVLTGPDTTSASRSAQGRYPQHEARGRNSRRSSKITKSTEKMRVTIDFNDPQLDRTVIGYMSHRVQNKRSQHHSHINSIKVPQTLQTRDRDKCNPLLCPPVKACTLIEPSAPPVCVGKAKRLIQLRVLV